MALCAVFAVMAGNTLAKPPEVPPPPKRCTGVSPGPPYPVGDEECNDGNSCTDDVCVSTYCWNIRLTGTACGDGDGNPCTEGVCDAGVCEPEVSSGAPCFADDDDPCTEGICEVGVCVPTPISGPACADDGDPCTDSICWDGQCTHPPANDYAPCEEDENVCTHDWCLGGECRHPPACEGCACESDGNMCTDDHCHLGECVHQPLSGVGCQSDGNPCTSDMCQQGICTHTPLPGLPCNDGNFCTEDDQCSAGGVCVGTQVRDCNDHNPCTDDDCVGNGCVHTNNTGPCNDEDGNPCTQGICEAGWCAPEPLSGVSCDDHDGDPCTQGVCHVGICVAEPVVLPPQDGACVQYDCGVGIGLPYRIFVNDDDDNDNGVADYLEDEPVPMEDDLGMVLVGSSWECPPPECESCPDPPEEGDHLHLMPPASMALYGGDDRSEPVDGTLFYPWPNVLWVEGRYPTYVCRAVEYRLCCPATTGSHCRGYSEMTPVIRVASVEWQKVEEDSLDLDECPNNGGKRIFPGKLSPDDESAWTRRNVKLVATIEPPTSGVWVYLKVFDVDDPFDQLHADMASVGLIDSDTVGSDNRGGGEIGNFQAVTNQDGQASVTIIVSMQPGDNYRGAATVVIGASSQVQQADADALSSHHDEETDTYTKNGDFQGYKVPVTWSKMLTVWRKLHVETDSMARPSFAENTIDTSWNEPRFPSGVLLLDISDQDNNDDFENGFIRIKAAGFPDIVTRIITFEQPFLPGNDVVHTNITEAQWGDRPTEGDWPCTISDDDLADEANFTAGIVGCDMGQGQPPAGFLPLPATSGLAVQYQPAYILPVIEDEHTSQGAYPFYKNMNPELNTNWDPGRLVLRGLPVSTAGFWTAYVFSAFQARDNADADSEPTSTKGVTTHPNGSTHAHWSWGNSYTGMAAVFVEVIRDAYPSCQEGRTVAHEIAHTLGAAHLGQASVPGDGGLMDETEQGPAFLAQSLETLREYVEP